MATAKLLYLHSPDVDDLEKYTPEKEDYFCILVQAMIGPKDGSGEESFDFIVCTPKWLEKQIIECDYLLGRHHLFLAKYNYELLKKSIEMICINSQGKDWQDIAGYIGRFGKWEFEDYKKKET